MRPLAIVTNPPTESVGHTRARHISGAVQSIVYTHADDGQLYEHDFTEGTELDGLADGTLQITHAGDRNLHRDFGGQRFLVNPPRRKKMAHRRLPPRHKSGPKKGQFMSRRRAAPKRKRARSRAVVAVSRPRKSASPKRRRALPRQAAPRARSRARRRNPPRFSVRAITKQLTDGAMDATLVLAGKAATRTIPLAANLPKDGNIGLAVQALTAVVVGMIAQRVLSPSRARMVVAGGLSAPLETLVVSYNVPFLAPALSPTEGDAQIGAYGMGGYVAAPIGPGANGVGGYVQEDPGLGQYYGEPAFA